MAIFNATVILYEVNQMLYSLAMIAIKSESNERENARISRVQATTSSSAAVGRRRARLVR